MTQAQIQFMKTTLLALSISLPCLALAQAPRIEADAGVAAMLSIAHREYQRVKPGALTGGVLVNSTAKSLARLCTGAVALSGAARAIGKPERESCAQNKIAFVELPLASDSLAVVVNPSNSWAKQVSLAELKRAWLDAPGKAGTWRQMNAAWPETPLKLYGPGPSLGLAEFAHGALAAGGPKPGPEMRRDFTASEVLTVVADGVARDRASLGLVDRATYEANRKRVRLVLVVEEKALSFPLYVYVSTSALQNSATAAYLDHVLANGDRLAREAGLVPLAASVYQEARRRIAAARTQ